MAAQEATLDWRASVRAVLDDATWIDRLVALAAEATASTPNWKPETYDDETLRQAVRGFVAVLKEALDGGKDDMRRLFMETAIPAFVQAGQSPGSLVSAATTYQVLLASELVSAVPEAARRETLKWTATFAGSYVSELCTVATRNAS